MAHTQCISRASLKEEAKSRRACAAKKGLLRWGERAREKRFPSLLLSRRAGRKAAERSEGRPAVSPVNSSGARAGVGISISMCSIYAPHALSLSLPTRHPLCAAARPFFRAGLACSRRCWGICNEGNWKGWAFVYLIVRWINGRIGVFISWF